MGVTRTFTASSSLLATVLLVACGGVDRNDDSGLDSAGDGIDVGDDGDGDGEIGDGDGGAGEGGADGSAGDGFDFEPECQRERFDLGVAPPSVMLVLDKSSSMSEERWMSQGELVTRWSSLHGVVSDLVTSYDATIDFGATMFPAVDSGHYEDGFEAACTVADAPDVATGSETASAILDAMPGPDVDVQGATPASAGMMTALQHLASDDHGQRAVVLVTDGLANCASEDEMFLYDEGLPELVSNAYEDLDVPTYVVGIDIRDEWVDYAQANAHEALDEVARAGGVPRDGDLAYYAADDAQTLYEAIDQIAARIECTVPLNAAVPEDATFEIIVDDAPVSEVTDCASEDGWRFTDPAQRSTIELCGRACDALRVQGQMETQTCEDVAILPVP